MGGCQHTSAYVSIRRSSSQPHKWEGEHSLYIRVSVRQHTSADVKPIGWYNALNKVPTGGSGGGSKGENTSKPEGRLGPDFHMRKRDKKQTDHTRQHTSAYAYVSLRQHT
jgi:hypothetical protein